MRELKMKLTRRMLMGAAMGGYLLSAGAAMAKTELTFWSWRQEDKAFYNEVIKKFQEKEPEISVKFETYAPENYQTILSTALGRRARPGRDPGARLRQPRDDRDAGLSARARQAEPCPSSRISPKRRWRPRPCGPDGKVYAVPFATQTQLVIYNKKIFADAGVKPPKTWDELMAAGPGPEGEEHHIHSPTARRPPGRTRPSSAACCPPCSASSSRRTSSSGKANFTDPRFVNALAKLKDISQYFAPNFIGVDYAVLAAALRGGPRRDVRRRLLRGRELQDAEPHSRSRRVRRRRSPRRATSADRALITTAAMRSTPSPTRRTRRSSSSASWRRPNTARPSPTR